MGIRTCTAYDNLFTIRTMIATRYMVALQGFGLKLISAEAAKMTSEDEGVEFRLHDRGVPTKQTS